MVVSNFSKYLAEEIMMNGKKLLSIIAISTLSLFCFACAMQHKTVTSSVREEMINDLKEGRLTLRCKLDCDWTWLQNYPSMAKLHNLAMWEDLSVLVMQIGLENGPSYFFLGKAADGLGYYDAAIKYYNYSLALYNDPRALNHCEKDDKPNHCGDVDYNYEIPLLVTDAAKKRDALLRPVVTAQPEPPQLPPPPKNKPDPTVKAAQENLARLAYTPGTPDGLMGKKTREALRQFQQDNNIAVTGKLNKETIALLEKQEVPVAPPSLENEMATPSVVTDGNGNPPEAAKEIAGTNKDERITDSGVQGEPGKTSEPAESSEKSQPRTSQAQQAIEQGIISESTHVLSKPSITADALGPITAGTIVNITGKENDFYKIKYQDKEAFVYSDFIKKK